MENIHNVNAFDLSSSGDYLFEIVLCTSGQDKVIFCYNYHYYFYLFLSVF